VSYKDTVYRLGLMRNKENNYEGFITRIYYDLVCVDIIGSSENIFLLTEHPKAGTIGKYPSRFIEVKGKLFFWYDDEYPLTEEVLKVFRKYGVFPPYYEGEFQIPEIHTDDAKKGACYYFCRSNTTRFKRVISNRGMGYYDPPKIKCTTN
jgi:hypothetical protein